MAQSSRVLPHNLDAEKSILGAVLLRNDALNHLDSIEEEDFYDPRHRAVFSAMRALDTRSRPIDEVTLEEELSSSGKLEAIGGLSFLSELALAVPTADNITHYAEIVQDKHTARQLMLAASEIAAKGYGEFADVQDYIEEAETKIFEVTQRNQRGQAVNIKSLLKGVFETLDSRFAATDGITGIPTGYGELDQKTAGLQPSDLIILAARPAMGKTSLAMSIVQNCAMTHGIPVLAFSLEMSSMQLAERMLCSEARIDSSLLRRGQLQRQDMTNLTYAANNLAKAPIYIDDTPALSVREVRAKARRFCGNRDIFPKETKGLIVVDYLQLMRGSNQHRNSNREQEISEISRGLKALAKEIACPVLALSQLNRSLESRQDKRPMLSDLRECVAGDTLVVLADGRREPIASLVGTAPRVIAMRDDGKIVAAESDRVWRVGRRPVFEIALRSGRRIRATAKHRLYGARGWCRVGDLAAGDRVAIARTLPAAESPERWPDARVALLGQMIGDGSFLKGQPMRFASASEENSELVASSARTEFGCEVKRYAGRGEWHQLLISGNGNRWHPAGVNAWLRELGIFGQRSHEKRVPGAAFRLAEDQIGLLLRHLWATDGCIWTSDEEAGARGRVYFATCSPLLADDVAALLLRLGIVARIRVAPQGSYRPAYHVIVSGADNQLRFLDRVGAFGPRALPAKRLRAALATKRANTNVDTLPREVFEQVKLAMSARGISQRAMAALRGTSYCGTSHFKFAPSRDVIAEYAELLGDHELRRQASSDLFWDEILSIAEAGEEDVYDLTVPGPASWLADGIVSHNSGAIEQDADQIVFIYRDEVYTKEACERPGIAEVIIGKNRHGPVATVELRFEGRYTRFDNLSHRDDGYDAEPPPPTDYSPSTDGAPF